MIEEKRGELVEALARIGLNNTIKEGMFDIVLSEGGDSPASILLQLEQLTATSTDHTLQIDTLADAQAANGVSLTSIQEKASRQEAAIASQTSEIERIEAAVNSAEAIHVEFRNHFSTLDTDVDALETSNVDLRSRMSAVESVDVNHQQRITTLEDVVTGSGVGSIAELTERVDNKADLEGGKIPLSQLPELPTGRKVTVSDASERLSLTDHTDITIAYQQDDGQAYILGAGEDPTIEGNWSVLGNTQGSGVTAFNGRTGVVTPSAGDYSTAMVSPTTDRGYTSSTDRTRWDSKASIDSVTAAVNALRTEVSENYVSGADDTFLRTDDTTVLKRNELGQSGGGIPTLGANGLVLAAQLPPPGLTSAQAARLTAVESLARLADEKGDSAATNISILDGRVQTLVASGTTLAIVNNQVQTLRTQQTETVSEIARLDGVDDAQNDRLTALEEGSSNGIPVSQKGASEGVATLNTDTKIPMSQILTNVATGIPTLDASNKIATARLYTNVANGIPTLNAGGVLTNTVLPPHLPQSSRIWRDVKGVRAFNTYFTNNSTSNNEMRVYVRSATSTSTTRHLVLYVYNPASEETFAFRSDAQGAAGDRWMHLSVDVPLGWRYAMSSNGGSTAANIEFWYEMS